jgi:DNA-binding NarL/FixJ family response regulator
MDAPAGVAVEPERKAKVGYRSLFGIRDYQLLFAGLVTSQSGSWAYNVALIVYVFNATHSPAWVAGASVARFLSALLSSAFGGVVGDRVERVRLMATLDTVAMIVQGALAATAAVNAPVLLVIARATLAQVAVGRSNEEIGAELFMSPATAKTHVSRAMSKLGARDRAQLVIAAYESGLVVPGRS